MYLRHLKRLGLLPFYFSLLPEHKQLLLSYGFADPVYTQTLRRPCQFLWVTAANALPHGHWDFCEFILHFAWQLAEKQGLQADLAHIHANLAQLYSDQVLTKQKAVEKCLFHCQQVLKTGYFTRWAQQLLEEMSQLY
ncbi:hypothetical protein SAMN02745885_00909 [Carboxydocella sporoproducens DSM 16521]|uniref:Uncharacterized protein n=2 Tax=Carboxydocella TaxID=178898 RepID=A0A1T4NHM5_9FIRM|nr:MULTISPECIES: hypothetical protein [Carboxydocella]AVX20045.1 hypothetical protein CFE_0847 [Carboxydocella thermautotrophica]AVX30462.1 hypothetical protein CTH_0862 [Carboxydocella thermautotrophica]SJZ78645.1 hypothetical protein SAMN02745885_00909 [Carboxydocella sporoproducens DSM 16521]